MRRRSRIAGDPVKVRHRKAAARKRPNVPKAARRHNSSATSHETEVVRLTRELHEAREQQKATSEVLSVISSSPGELEPVFNAMLENATRICAAKIGILFRYEDGAYSAVSLLGVARAYADFLHRGPIRAGPETGLGRVASTKQTVHITDTQAEQAYADRDPLRLATAELGGARSLLNVPMLKHGKLIGAIGIYRQEVRPFTDKQIELVTNFAAQAVIAIENARLLSELRQRTADLAESLEQQTATSEVLRVISSSPGNLEAVFEAMLENATRICEANFGVLNLHENGALRPGAMHNVPSAFADWLREQRDGYRPIPGSPLDHVLRTKELSVTADHAVAVSPGRATTLGGARSTVCVPMIKDDKLVGTITIYRQEVRPFNDKQIALVQNFAAQAIIAIENARLLSELRESLQQQTATADVLRVINSSPGALEPVFQAMLEKATRLCEAEFGNLFLYDGEAFRTAALYQATQAYTEARQKPFLARELHPEVPLVRIVQSKGVIHVADVRTEQAYLAGDVEFSKLVDVAGARTLLLVPLLRETQFVGAFAIYRKEVRRFSDKQIELVQNFAAQAVIAIENARLLNELKQRTTDLTESLEQQTATSEVLRVISSSPGDLEPVFQSMLANATRICEADSGFLFRVENDDFRIVASLDKLRDAERLRHQVFKFGPSTPIGRAKRTRQIEHVPNLAEDQAYVEREPLAVWAVEQAHVRTVLVVPMLKEQELIGVFGIQREEVKPFTDRQIDLVKNFAAQAVIAIENARLMTELRQRTGDLTESLEQQTATSDVLKVISSSPGDLGPVFQAMLANAIRMCAAKFGMLYRYDGHSFTLAAHIGAGPRLLQLMQGRPFTPHPDTVLGRLHATNDTVSIADATQERAYFERNPVFVAGVEEDGTRGLLGVPMLQDNKLVGAFVVFRQVAGPFTDKQVELVQNFAAQAVIAIENTRLLNELRQRTEDLSKSLDDLRGAQDRLVQTQKLASLGQLTAGIAHEIKNPLNFVNNFSGISVELLTELQEAVEGGTFDDNRRTEIVELTETLRGNLDKIVQHGKRADSIVKNMLLHSREGSGDRRPINVNALVEESLNLAYHGARAEKQGFSITLERSFDPEAGEADVFPQEITRVLLNLISNGFYAATTRQEKTDEGGYEPILTASTRSLDDRVEIRIRDNGIGIPPEVKEKMFNPFFTTKPAGEGTGLGLSISHDIIVKQHSGAIEVDTEPGEFTEFRIILPRTSA